MASPSYGHSTSRLSRDPGLPSSPWPAPSWGRTYPLKQEADSLNLPEGRGPDEGGEAMLIWLVDEVVTWQERGGTTGMHPCPLSPRLQEQGRGGQLG